MVASRTVEPAVSIVVPTYSRMDVLPEVLDALGRQDVAVPYEIVVVDDGSADATWSFLSQKVLAAELPLIALRQDNRGPAAARNLGVANARGPLVAFLGDDTVPQVGWLGAHLRAHQRLETTAPRAVVGYTGWHPRMRLNPFLRYINEYGLQFGYALIEDPDAIPFNFFYTSNVSLPRQLLVEQPFDEGFPYPAWEDIELAYRLTSTAGLRLAYEPAARTAHDHPTTFLRFCARQEKAGYCGVVFAARHPELGSFVGVGPGGPPPAPSRWSVAVQSRLVHALHSLPVETPRLWEHVLRLHYIRGLQRAWADRGRSKEERS